MKGRWICKGQGKYKKRPAEQREKKVGKKIRGRADKGEDKEEGIGKKKEIIDKGSGR